MYIHVHSTTSMQSDLLLPLPHVRFVALLATYIVLYSYFCVRFVATYMYIMYIYDTVIITQDNELCVHIQQLDQEAQRLIREQPSSQELIDEKQGEITENWEQLTQRADERYILWTIICQIIRCTF